MSEIPLVTARIWARRLRDVVTPHAERVVVVGSIRRGRDPVGDIELLVEPTMRVDQADLFAGVEKADTEAVVRALRQDDSTRAVVKGRDRYVQMRLGGSGRLEERRPKLDIFFCHPPSSWGALMVIRTGPADLSRVLVTRLRAKGLRNHRGAVWAPGRPDDEPGTETTEIDGTVWWRVSTPTEEAYFEACGVEYVPAERRDELARNLTMKEAT